MKTTKIQTIKASNLAKIRTSSFWTRLTISHWQRTHSRVQSIVVNKILKVAVLVRMFSSMPRLILAVKTIMKASKISKKPPPSSTKNNNYSPRRIKMIMIIIQQQANQEAVVVCIQKVMQLEHRYSIGQEILEV